MNNENSIQSGNQSVSKPIPLILRNPGKAIVLAGVIGFIIGSIVGVVVALLNSTAPSSGVEPANAIQRHPTLFTIIITPVCFGILGLGLGIMSWISTKLQPKKS